MCSSDLTGVTADVVLSPAALQAPTFALNGYGGTVKGSAHFDLRDTRKPAYAVKAAIENVQADALLATWTPARNFLRGTLSTTLDFSGAGEKPEDLRRTLTLVGLAALREGQLGPGPALDALSQFVKVGQLRAVPFKELKLPLRIEQGRLFTDAVSLTGPSGDWKLSGAIGFDGSLDYAVSVTLPPEIGASLGARSALAAGAIADDKGRILLDLHLGGNAKAPRVSWDTRAMRDRLAGRASQALVDQRTKLEGEAKAAAQKALMDRLGAASDSARQANLRHLQQSAQDSLRRAAGGLLDQFFKGRKPAPTDTTKPAPPDTTHH